MIMIEMACGILLIKKVSWETLGDGVVSIYLDIEDV